MGPCRPPQAIFVSDLPELWYTEKRLVCSPRVESDTGKREPL